MLVHRAEVGLVSYESPPEKVPIPWSVKASEILLWAVASQLPAQRELKAQHACGAAVRQKRQENPVGMVRWSCGKQADAVFAAGRKHGMGKGDFAVV